MLATLLAPILLAQASTRGALLPQKSFDLKVVDVTGVKRTVPAAGAKATVVVFVMTDCPIANRMAPDLVKICDVYRPRGVAFDLAYVDPAATKNDILSHQKMYGYVCPAFLDRKQSLVKAMGAKISPEAVVIDAKGKMVYRGRINDLYETHGQPRARALNNDLRNAIEEVLAGKKVTNPVMPAIGCFISPP